MVINPHLNHISKAVLMGITVRAYPVAEITVLLLVFVVYFAIVSLTAHCYRYNKNNCPSTIILSLKSICRPYFKRAALSRKAKVKSHKLSSSAKLWTLYGGVAIHLKDTDASLNN